MGLINVSLSIFCVKILAVSILFSNFANSFHLGNMYVIISAVW